jgi:hypothetical protein
MRAVPETAASLDGGAVDALRVSPQQMTDPTIEVISDKYCVTYLGMRRCFAEDWKAQWFYCYCLRLKSCGLEPAHAPDDLHS